MMVMKILDDNLVAAQMDEMGYGLFPVWVFESVCPNNQAQKSVDFASTTWYIGIVQ